MRNQKTMIIIDVCHYLNEFDHYLELPEWVVKCINEGIIKAFGRDTGSYSLETIFNILRKTETLSLDVIRELFPDRALRTHSYILRSCMMASACIMDYADKNGVWLARKRDTIEIDANVLRTLVLSGNTARMEEYLRLKHGDDIDAIEGDY